LNIKAKSETELRHLREEVVSLRGNLKQSESARLQQKIKKKLAEQENELTLQSSRLKLIVRNNPALTIFNSGGIGDQKLTSHSPSSSHQQHHHHYQQSNNSVNSNQTSSLSTNQHNSSGIHLSNASANSSNLSSLTSGSNQQSSNSATHGQQNLNVASQSGTASSSSSSGVSSSSSSSSSSSTATAVANNIEQYVFLFTSDFERIAWLEEINAAIYACKIFSSYF
jgi:hypothetical protein